MSRHHGRGLQKDRRLPIWARQEPGSRKPRHSRDQIAAAALKIADTEGFDAVTMRRIARELGSGAMTLYHYVHTKEDLIALMDDALMGEVLIPPAELPQDWRAALTAIARRTRQGFMRHPWAIHALDRAAPGPNGMKHFEQSLEAVARTGLPLEQRMELILLVDDFVFGHVLRTPEVADHSNLDPDGEKGFRSFAEAQIATGAFPNIAAMAEFHPTASKDALTRQDAIQARFERGLAMLLDGAARSYALGAK